MKNNFSKELEFKADSLRSLAASLKNALKEDKLSETDAHEKGWELARLINEKTNGKFSPPSVKKWISSNMDVVSKVSGIKMSGELPKEKNAVANDSPKKELAETDEVKAIKKSNEPINEKIRKLFALNYGCADIRKFLVIDYQRVKNVEKRMKKSGAKK